MKALLQNKTLALLLASILMLAVLGGCKKNQDCSARVNVIYNSTGQKALYKWVVIDVSPNTPPGPKSPYYPIKLNTGREGYVEFTVPLEGIPYAYVYDSANFQLAPPIIGSKPIKLEPGETVIVDVPIN